MNLNLTSESFQNYKDRLFGLTFSERFLTLHYAMNKEEKDSWVKREETAKIMRYNGTINEKDISKEIALPQKYLPVIRFLSQEFSFDSLTSPVSSQDLIKGTLRAHAALNKRTYVCSDDLKFVMKLKPYLTNPFSPNQGMIVRYAAKGLSPKEICYALGKDSTYNTQVVRTLEKAKLRGILDA